MFRRILRNPWLPVAALCVVFFLQCLFASLGKSPTGDETNHIVSGATYIANRSIVANPQHPPLMKELAGLSLAIAGIHWHNLFLVPLENLPSGWEWPAGARFLRDSGVARTLFWARLPLLLLSPLLGFLVYWWGRELAGARAGLGALFLFALDPTMVAHSYLVTTDAGVTTFSLLFLLTLYRYLKKPGMGRLAAAGAALGLALCAKFSAVFLLPIAAVLLAAGCLWPPSPSEKTAPDRPAGAVSRLIPAVSDMAFLCVAAIVAIQICYFSLRGPILYYHGMSQVYADKVVGFRAYLGGQLKPRFASYFAVAWLLKEPLATIALTLGGTVLALCSRAIPRLSKWFLFLPPAVFFTACTLWAENIGIRYAMPAMVFGYITGGIAVAALLRGGALGRVAALAAGAWLVVAAAGIYPDHLSYFNEAACLPDHLERIGLDGGSRCGVEWLADSNVDWGQSLPQLKVWLDRNAPGRTVRLECNCDFATAYGIKWEKAGPYMGPVPSRGLYAITSHDVAVGPALHGTDWLREEPEAIVGHAYYIFEF